MPLSFTIDSLLARDPIRYRRGCYSGKPRPGGAVGAGQPNKCHLRSSLLAEERELACVSAEKVHDAAGADSCVCCNHATDLYWRL